MAEQMIISVTEKVMTNRWVPGGVAIMLALSLLTTSAVAANTNDHRVVLVYSEDDALGKPLAKLYQWIAYGQSRVPYYQEDAFADRFRTIGLHKPRALDEDRHQDRPKHAYYRLKFPDKANPRVVYLEDRHSVGRYEDDYMTNIWILKSGADEFAPEDVDVAILLNADSPDLEHAKATIHGPLFFTKIASPADLALPENQREALVPHVGNAIPYVIQRIFIYHAAPIVLAEDKMAFLAYRVKDGAIEGSAISRKRCI